LALLRHVFECSGRDREHVPVWPFGNQAVQGRREGPYENVWARLRTPECAVFPGGQADNLLAVAATVRGSGGPPRRPPRAPLRASRGLRPRGGDPRRRRPLAGGPSSRRAVRGAARGGGS